MESGKFLSGLLPEVILALTRVKEEFDFDDKRTDILFDHTEIGPNFFDLWTPKKPPRGGKVVLEDYQCDLASVIQKYRRGVITAPTSAGKTYVGVATIKSIKEKTPILLLQNRVDLAEQNYEELINWGVPNVGTCWGGHFKPNLITVATIQSIEKIKNLLPFFRALLVDEIHDMMSDTAIAAYKLMKSACFRMAMSATPYKYGESDKVHKFMVKGYFGPTLKIKSAENGILTTGQLQKRGRLSASQCTFFPVHEPNLQYEIFIDAVTRGIAENQEFHEMVKKLALSLTGRTLILVERISHGDYLEKILPGAIWVRGQDKSKVRKEVVRRLQEETGNCIAIATQGIFNTGINVFVHNLINAAGGQAEHTIIQRMGRGLRTADDKTILNYYDFIFYNNEYLEKHSKKRVRILKGEGHDVEIKDFPF